MEPGKESQSHLNQPLVDDLVSHRQQELENAIEEWTRRCGVDRNFPFRFFSSHEARQQLRSQLSPRLSDGLVIEDIAADLVISLQHRLESGEIDLCGHPPLRPKPLEDRGKFAVAKAVLEACAVTAPEVLSGRLDAEAELADVKSEVSADASQTGIAKSVESTATILSAVSGAPVDWMGRQLATSLGALPPVEGRLASLILWVRDHCALIGESVDSWIQSTGVPADFPLRFFERSRDLEQLRSDMRPHVDDGEDIEDLAFDLILSVAIRMDRGLLGDVASLRTKIGSGCSPLDDRYRLSRLILRVAAFNMPHALHPVDPPD